jgi:hypothetical protein
MIKKSTGAADQKNAMGMLFVNPASKDSILIILLLINSLKLQREEEYMKCFLW